MLGPGTQLPCYYELKRRCSLIGFEGPRGPRFLLRGVRRGVHPLLQPGGRRPDSIVQSASRQGEVPPRRRRAVAKILKTEGPLGFYKGALSHYARASGRIWYSCSSCWSV